MLTTRLLFWVVLVASLSGRLFDSCALANPEYSAEELKAAEEEKKAQIATKQRELQATKARLSKAARARNTAEAKAANAEVGDLERTLQQLRKRDVASFAAERRAEVDRQQADAQRAAAEQQAADAARQAREAARLEVLQRPRIQPDTMTKGDQGFFQDAEGNEYLLRVEFVREGGQSVLAEVPNKKTFVVVDGIDGAGLVSNRWFSLPQQMKVVGTDDFLANGEQQVTYFVISPVDQKEKAVVMRDAPLPPSRPQRIPPPYQGNVPRTYP